MAQRVQRPGAPPRASRRSVRDALAGTLTDDFRPDVEGLRALAVILVLIFHADIRSVAGGFIGVDVFFVVSGFLITRLLLKEMAERGTIRLSAFWARRARRLLPAAALTLIVTLVLSRLILSPLQNRSVILDGLAVAAFVGNFRFASSLGDYFGAQLGALRPSPLLHYWSLAVEEQFYLLWPATLVGLSTRPRQFRRLLVTVIGAGIAVSILLSWWMTNNHPTAAFYLLPARMAELLGGALLAVAGRSVRRIPAFTRAGWGWLGLTAIATAAIFFDQRTAFPGTAMLLPVIGTMAVIAAGGPGSSVNGPSRLLDHPVLQWVGRHSYAIYLWHWPILVLAQARHGQLSLFARALAMAVAVALSYLSVRFVENPIRFSAVLGADNRRSLILGGALSGASLLLGAVLWFAQPSLAGGQAATHVTLVAANQPQVIEPGGSNPDAPASSTSSGGTTAGDVSTTEAPQPPAANDLAGLVASTQRVLAQALTVDAVPSNLRPALTKAFDDKAALYGDGCVNIGVDDTVHRCVYGVKDSSTTYVLLGDSHAAQWFPALEQIATERSARLVVFTKGGCPPADVALETNTLGRTCPAWRTKVMASIATLSPDLVVVTSSSRYFNSDADWQAGMQRTVSKLTASAKRVVLLSDSPGASDVAADCLSRNLSRASACNNRRDRAIAPGRVAAERDVAAATGAVHVDPTDWLCTADACPVIVGDILMYRDVDHLTTEASELLLPLLRAALP